MDPVASSTATRGFSGFFHIGSGAVEDFVPRCHDLSDPLQVCLDGPFRYIISMENDYDSSWGYYVDIMGILCGYHGAHYFQTKPRIMLLTTFLAGSWVNASNLVAPKTGFLIPSGKHTLWLCQNSY